MDVLKMLEQDHRQVEDMLQRLRESEPGPDRAEVTTALQKALELHMRFEEEHLYPLLQELEAEMEQEAETEHQLARQGLAQAVELMEEPGFGAAVDMLAGGISHHVEEEEEEAFPRLRRDGDEDRLRSLATTLLEEKRRSGMLVDERATKEDLREIAVHLGVDAPSSMSKQELIEAIRTQA